jgi:hypothetical protein
MIRRVHFLAMFAVLLMLFASSFSVSSAQSASILIDSPDIGANQIQFYAPSGQSFTALGSHLTSIGFFIQPFNTFLNDPTFTMELLAGAGTGGSILGSATVTLADDFMGFALITDFNGIALTPGGQYTAIMLNDTARWAYELTGADVYAGGTGFVEGSPTGDLWFSASFTTAVPEPATWSMLLLGFVGIGLVGYRGVRKAAPASTV